MQWLKKLFGICDHKWEVFRETEIMRKYQNRTDDIRKVGVEIISRCSMCGKLKQTKFYV